MKGKSLLFAVVAITLFMSPVALSQTQTKVVVIPLDSTPPPATSKMIFMTVGQWDGNLGGLAGADEKCNSEAKSRGIRGTFQALLGADEGRPETRSIHYPLTYLSSTGNYLQSDYHDLFNSGVDNSVHSGGIANVWTGLNSDGSLVSENCSNWRSNSSAFNGGIGWGETTGTTWIDADDVNICSKYNNYLYCIEQ